MNAYGGVSASLSNKYTESAPSACAVPSGIMGQVQTIEKYCEGIFSALATLRDRIEPILRPDVPQPGTAGGADRCPGARLSDALTDIEGRLRALGEFVENTSGRVVL